MILGGRNALGPQKNRRRAQHLAIAVLLCTCGGGSRSGRATSYLGKVTGVATRAQSIAKVQASSLRKVTPPSLRRTNLFLRNTAEFIKCTEHGENHLGMPRTYIGSSSPAKRNCVLRGQGFPATRVAQPVSPICVSASIDDYPQLPRSSKYKQTFLPRPSRGH